jgi:SAM-dependent MidA family methyltransferase
MTALAALLARRIAATGPMTVADYMAECLLHPDRGYYTTRKPFGAAGDFTTAPEISQMFGELVGLCLAQAWLDQGAPGAFTLAELGPGRGTLMADLLRATRGVPGFHAAARVVLVEASPRLRAVQRDRLGQGVAWADRVEDLPGAPLFLIANEFLDALPIRQFQRGPEGFRERLVGLSGGRLSLGLSDPLPGLSPTPAFAAAMPGDVVEWCPAASAVATTLADRIARHGGVALLIDYGGWRSRGDTLQALRTHAFDDPFAHPGEADLTAHVDFEPLAIGPHAYATQGTFLARLGIAARAARLAQGLSGAALESHRAAHRRLTDPAEMGSLFKVLALHPGMLPPGFA